MAVYSNVCFCWFAELFLQYTKGCNMEQHRSEQKIPLIVIVGPTASGKSKLAVKLAQWKKTEIVSADSMQIYRGMQIGTAKPTEEEMQGITHHLIDFVNLEQSFSVADYVVLAKRCVAAIAQQGKLPIMVGGTGLYINSFLNNLQFTSQDKDKDLCDQLARKAERQGIEMLVEELRSFDPQSADRIDPHNVSRIIRAIEIYRTTGITMTEHMIHSRLEPSPYSYCMIGLDYTDRNILYEQINQRVEKMLEMGLVKEAREVLEFKNSQTALQAIGYKELIPYFYGDLTLHEAVDNIKRETRRYAKRQLTWFRRNQNIHWLKVDEIGSTEKLIEQAKKIVENFKF